MRTTRVVGLAVIALASVAIITACSSSSTTAAGSATVAGVRLAVTAAGANPTTCPISFDLNAALRAGGINKDASPGSVDASVSKTDQPAPDPLNAQLKQHMSAIDAVAGAEVDCEYHVGSATVYLRLLASKVTGAVNLTAPIIQQAAHLSRTELVAFLNAAPQPGEVKLVPGNEIAVGRPKATDGDMALLVYAEPSLPELTGNTLSTVASALVAQIRI